MDVKVSQIDGPLINRFVYWNFRGLYFYRFEFFSVAPHPNQYEGLYNHF